MRLTIDTESKTVEIESDVKAKDLTKALKQLLGDSWGDYSIIKSWPVLPVYPIYPTYPTYEEIVPYKVTFNTD